MRRHAVAIYGFVVVGVTLPNAFSTEARAQGLPPPSSILNFMNASM
jgi:hypothetical protein